MNNYRGYTQLFRFLIALCVLCLFKGFTCIMHVSCAEMSVEFHDIKDVIYKSGGIIYKESLEGGHWKGHSWTFDTDDSSHPLNNSQDAFSIGVKVDPALPSPTLLGGGWKWIHEKQEKGERESQIVAHVELENDQQPISIKVKSILDGTPVITRWLEIINTSDHPIALSSLTPWKGPLWEKDAHVMLGHSTRWHVPWEGWFGWREIEMGCHSLENRQGLVWDDPFFVLRNTDRSEYFFGQLAWPVNYRIDIIRKSGFSFSASPIAVNELRILDPGESVISPAVHLGYVHGSFDDSVHSMHQHIRRTVIPRPIPDRSYRIQCLFPEDQPLSLLHGRDCNEQNLSRFLDVCAECGVELFILDGPTWARGYGDWIAKEAWFPRGFEPLIQYAKNKGILFGVYAEVEGGRGEWRNTTAFKENPDWFLFRNPDYPFANFINISKQDAALYVESELKSLLQRYPIDIYRHDQNGCFGNEGSVTRKFGFLENDYWRYYDNWHGIVDRARKMDPTRIFQQASGSGSRLDLATLAHWNENYTSDRVSYPHVFQMSSGLSVYLPPEILVTPFGMAGVDQPDLITILRGVFALGQVPLLFNALLPRNPDEMTQEIKDHILHYTNLYKTFFRTILTEMKVYHHAPVNEVGGVESGDWFVMEFSDQENNRGWATIIRLRGEESSTNHFQPRGLNPDKNYTVFLDNNKSKRFKRGMDLLSKGIDVFIPARPRSELILFEEDLCSKN